MTGAAGVIGKALTRRLVASGARVLSVDIVPGDDISSKEHIQTDLSRDIPAQAFDSEVVFHLAATFERTEETPEFWEWNFNHNVLLPHRLLKALKAHSSLKVFIFASSYLIYDPKLYLDGPEVRYVKESDPIAPRNLVGVAKYFVERELDFLQKTGVGFRVASARIFRVYGCGSRDVISRWVRFALRGKPIEVYGRNNRFDYIFADDVAAGLMKLAENEASQGVVNLGSGVPRSISDVLNILKAEFRDLEVKSVEWSGPTEASCADTTFFMELTGWTPQVSLEQGMAQLIAYEKRRQSSSSERPV